ncbi:Nuclease-related domain [Macleaya cordata]|uniref:Nuclease-related domain n=1 Tax=Macleaya cordata TaxID=56857 RepID=A0A200PXI3_MACCD|nr:Nuclease-related domain [Macleaya cordata]
MWAELLCGLVIYRLFRRFFYDDDIFEVETNDTDSKFLVAGRIEKLYGGKVYMGLRIPDSDTGSRQNIDMVLVTKGEVVVIGVKNYSGFVRTDADGSWICIGEKERLTEKHPDPVAETKRQVGILESYFEQRGVELPIGYVSCRVVLSNPNCRIINSEDFPPEVVPFDQSITLKPETKSVFSGWIKDAFRGGKKEMQDGINQKLHFILSTAPMWDRLELKENKNLLGEFLEFKGKQEDVQALRHIKRSKVSRLVIQKSTMFSLGRSKLQVLYSARDYRSEGASGSEWKEVTVKSSTEVLFQPQNSTKIRKFKLSSIISMSLSA